MKPIFVKVIAASIFLLAVGVSLFYFTKTIFENQQRSKASTMWQENANALWKLAPPFSGYPSTGETWYPWSNGGPTAVWESPVAGRVYICNKTICWTLIRNGSTIAWDGSAWDIGQKEEYANKLGPDANGNYLWSGNGPTAAWTWKVQNSGLINDGQPFVQETILCNGNSCWRGVRSMAAGNNTFVWRDLNASGYAQGKTLNELNNFWITPVAGIYGGKDDALWKNGGLTASWDNPKADETALCGKGDNNLVRCVVIQHPTEANPTRWTWLKSFNPSPANFGNYLPYLRNSKTITLENFFTSAWTSPVSNIVYTCNGSVCWIYDTNAGIWENDGNAIDLALAIPTPTITGMQKSPVKVSDNTVVGNLLSNQVPTDLNNCDYGVWCIWSRNLQNSSSEITSQGYLQLTSNTTTAGVSKDFGSCWVQWVNGAKADGSTNYRIRAEIQPQSGSVPFADRGFLQFSSELNDNLVPGAIVVPAGNDVAKIDQTVKIGDSRSADFSVKYCTWATGDVNSSMALSKISLIKTSDTTNPTPTTTPASGGGTVTAPTPTGGSGTNPTPTGGGSGTIPTPTGGGAGSGSTPTKTPTKTPSPTPTEVDRGAPIGSSCTVTEECKRGLLCKGEANAKTCQQGQTLLQVCNDTTLVCGRDYYCANKNASGVGVCQFKVCEGSVTTGCVTATPTPTATFTPTPTSYQGTPAPKCSDSTNCGERPYFYMLEIKDQNNLPNYEIRYYDSSDERPNDGIFNIVQGSTVSDNLTEGLRGGDYSPDSRGYYKTTLPYQYLYRVRLPDNTPSKNMKIFVASGMSSPPWYIKEEVQGGITYKVYLRPGLIETPTPTHTNTPTPQATPPGLNLYLDPSGTDATRDAVRVSLWTGVQQGVRRGEKFTVRVVASPENADFRSEYIFLKELKVPIQYALPTNMNSIVIEGIQSTNNPECSDYKLMDPQADEITTISAFYLRLIYNKSTPRQLHTNTCVAEVSFSVKEGAQYGDRATLTLLTEGESDGIAEIDTINDMKGLHALAYHMTNIRPSTTPAVTPATIHPKVNLSYDMTNRIKTITVDTSRSVAPNAPDLIIENVGLTRLAAQDTACGPVKMVVDVSNIGGSAATDFKIKVNNQIKTSSQTVDPSSAGLPKGGTKRYYFESIKFNEDGSNLIFADTDDDIIELREDNNYVVKKFAFADIPGNTNTNCPNPSNTPTFTPGPTSLTPTPTLKLNPNMINLNILVKVQGAKQGRISNQYSRMRFGVAIGGGKLEDNTDYIYNDFINVGDGKFQGVVTFDPKDVPEGGAYKILVKGPKHLTKRFCSTNVSGGYSYFCGANAGNITLQKGTTSYDFSGALLIAGDLPNGSQDGVVDSSDLAFVRDNLGIKDPIYLKVGDTNLDGIIDTQDYTMIVENLINNEDEN
ncbi:MAG: hypothetical protein U0525_05285 [Patescibacteria group bacterium]